MEWWQILLCVIFNGVWVSAFVSEIIVLPIINNRKYKEKRKQWDEAHPDLTRIRCKDCKYCKSETYYQTHYPARRPVYCRFLGRKIKSSFFCLMAEPTEGFYISKEKADIKPIEDAEVYFSPYGDCYHSSLCCPTIRSAYRYRGPRDPGSWRAVSDRRPCRKCWAEKDGVLYPKL